MCVCVCGWVGVSVYFLQPFLILRLSQNHEFPLRTDFGKISDTVLKENAVSSHNPHPSNHTPKMTLLAQRIDHGPPAAPVGPYLISLSSAVLPSTSGTPQRAPSPFPPTRGKRGGNLGVDWGRPLPLALKMGGLFTDI